MMQSIGNLQRFVLLLLLAPAATSAKSNLQKQARQFKQWRDTRFGCRGWTYWRCSGQLTDPATGAVLARLEGVEATRALRGDHKRGDDAADATDDDFLVEPRAFEVRRRYAYADVAESDELTEWRARPNALPRSVLRPPPYAATVRLGLRKDGTTVALRSSTEDKALEPRVAAFAVEGVEKRVDAYIGTPQKKGLMRLFGVGAQPSAAARRAQKGLKCRESYVVSRNAVSYRRLGEAPAWAGPGRLCVSELSARRVSRRALRRGSPVAQELAAELLEDVRAADGKLSVVIADERPDDVAEPSPKRRRGDKSGGMFSV